MPNKSSDSLIPPDDELMELLKWKAQYAPTQVPIVVLELFFAKMLSKEINHLKEELDYQIEELMKKLGQ